MTNYISARFNYNNQKIEATVLSDSLSYSTVTGYSLIAVDSKGVVVAGPVMPTIVSRLSKVASSYEYILSAELPFGLVGGSYGARQTGTTFVHNSDTVHGAGYHPGLDIYKGLLSPQKVDSLAGTPITITNGDAVFQGKITNITNKRQITYTGESYNLVNARNTNFAGDLLYIFSGSGSGVYASVTATGTQDTLYVDRSMSGYSGSYFKLMPRRNITGNTTWSAGSVNSQIKLDSAIYTGLGSNYLSSINIYGYISGGNESGFPYQQNPYLKGITSNGGMYVSFAKDSYSKTVSVGDMLLYRAFSTPSAMDQVAVIYHVLTGANPSTNYVLAYPSGVASNLEGFVDAYHLRANEFKVLNYPKYEDHINVIMYDQSTQSTPSLAGHTVIKAPSARVELTANDYDSAFSNVGDVSHFHIGPVVLSNGEIITNHELYLSGSLYNSDPTQTTADKTWISYATKNSNAAEYMTGEYFRDGVHVGTYTNSFTSAEMLHVDVRAKYGNTEVRNIVNLPVQPSA